MDRGVEMRAGMLDDAPPEQIETVLLKAVLALHLDAGLAREGRKLRRHGVGEIDDAPEAVSRRQCLRVRWKCARRKGGSTCTSQQSAARQRAAYRLLTAGNAHVGSSLACRTLGHGGAIHCFGI